MKKIVIYFMLALMLVCGFNVKPVYANEKGVSWEKFVELYTDLYAYHGAKVGDDGKSLTLDYGSNIELVYEPTTGVLELVNFSKTDSFNWGIFAIISVNEIYEIMHYGSSYGRLDEYVFSNIDNGFTIAEDGLEYEIVENDNDYIVKSYKIKITEALKNYDEYELIWDDFSKSFKALVEEDGHTIVDIKDDGLSYSYYSDVHDGTLFVEFSYDNGILELIVPPMSDYPIFSDYSVFSVLELYANMYGYSVDELLSYIEENAENNLTLEKDGIEYEAEIYPDFNAFTKFKLDISRPLNNLNEGLYEVVDGTFSYDVTKDETLKFRCSGPFELFEAVYIDGKIVDEANYKVSEGSTIIEFKPEFAKKLSVGKHYIEFAYSDGNVVEDTFEIIQTLENPKTSQNFGYKELALILGLLVSGYIVVKKTKFRFN